MPEFPELLFAEAWSAWGASFTWLELVAVAAAVAMVVCNMQVRVVAWPLAIFSSALYALLFRHHRLYGDAALQLFFIAVAGWGWWQWLRGTDERGRALVVRRLGARGRTVVVMAALAGWLGIGAFLARHTDSDVPWWDAFPTAVSVAGQWLLGRKYVENWLAWLAVNVVATGLFAWKGLWLTAALYALFVAMSVAGWFAWRRLAAQRGAA